MTGVSLSFACTGCGRPVEVALDPTTDGARCDACATEQALEGAGTIAGTGTWETCPVCHSTDLYQQRDFNRRLGLGLVLVGLLLGPFTHWISVGVAVVIDAALYLVVPPVAICYACSAQVRGLPRAALPPVFDIAIHDAYKFGKRFPPRREAAVAGPLAQRLRLEGKTP